MWPMRQGVRALQDDREPRGGTPRTEQAMQIRPRRKRESVEGGAHRLPAGAQAGGVERVERRGEGPTWRRPVHHEGTSAPRADEESYRHR
eukprot:5366974-Pyramimonas_sp.AAC.1